MTDENRNRSNKNEQHNVEAKKNDAEILGDELLIDHIFSVGNGLAD
jgi:hypothetical protein